MGSCSALPSPLQIVSQGQAKAESITLDLGTQIKQMLLLELATFLRRWVWGGGLPSHSSQSRLSSLVAQVGIPFLPLGCLSL